MDNSEFKKLVGKFSHLQPQLSQSDRPVEAKKAKSKRRNPFKTREILDDGDIDYKYHKGSSHYSQLRNRMQDLTQVVDSIKVEPYKLTNEEPSLENLGTANTIYEVASSGFSED